MARPASASPESALPAMSGPVAELKAALRRRLRDAAKNIPPAERAAASAQLRLNLEAQELWRTARSVLFYVPMADEPDILPLVAGAVSAGKIVMFPGYVSSDNHYVARQVRNVATDLQPGQFGIPEPSAACPLFDLKQLDFTLVPGLGFSFNGCRLGRGRGYYDRLLAQVSGVKCGAAFDWQVVADIPMEAHDIRLDCIVTPTRWHPAPSQART